jgi:hypothetical protein
MELVSIYLVGNLSQQQTSKGDVVMCLKISFFPFYSTRRQFSKTTPVLSTSPQTNQHLDPNSWCLHIPDLAIFVSTLVKPSKIISKHIWRELIRIHHQVLSLFTSVHHHPHLDGPLGSVRETNSSSSR